MPVFLHNSHRDISDSRRMEGDERVSSEVEKINPLKRKDELSDESGTKHHLTREGWSRSQTVLLMYPLTPCSNTSSDLTVMIFDPYFVSQACPIITNASVTGRVVICVNSC